MEMTTRDWAMLALAIALGAVALGLLIWEVAKHVRSAWKNPIFTGDERDFDQ